jgi:hypothetical protein
MPGLRDSSMPNKFLATVLSVLLIQLPQATAIQAPATELVNKSYLELLNSAHMLKLSESEAIAIRKRLAQERKGEEKRLDREIDQLKKQIDHEQKQLSALNKAASRDTEEMTGQRRELHCRILKLDRQLFERRIERDKGVPVSYDNKLAKLDLIQQWPAKKNEIDQILASGRARQRRYGDVEDIGVRKIQEGQARDVKLGEDAAREMKAYGLMPPELEDKELKEYLQTLANTVAANSDLTIPVRLVVLQSPEINAFALPGGLLFLNTGLIDKAVDESELVGVIAHELAHVVARHGPRLMKRVTIANIIYQAAQVAAIIFTGGVAGIGTYYALQYGFFGLGMALELTLLGVNREFEAEADQLGVQYAWRAGYDPRGFITFFDKMASEKGYVKSASFFRTHPPFFDRIVSTFSEIEYLPAKESLRLDSTDFQRAKSRLKPALEKGRKDMRNRPALRRFPECEDEQLDRQEPITEERLPDLRIESALARRTLGLNSPQNCAANPIIRLKW